MRGRAEFTIYAHTMMMVIVDATNPEGWVSAGRARMPAPTVVPATRKIAPDMEPCAQSEGF
jgi:hypothetical protein